MDIATIGRFNPAIGLINALYPTSPVRPAAGAGELLPLAGAADSISLLGHLLNDVERLQGAAQALNAPFDIRTVSLANAALATATAAPGSAVGTHLLEVEQLAQAQTLSTAAQASSLSSIGDAVSSTISFGFANGATREVTLAGGSNTLAGIAAAINGAAIGIAAEVVAAPAGYRLELSGRTGAEQAFTIGVSGDAAVAGLLAYPAGGGSGPTLAAAARDAAGRLDGVAFTSGSNRVDGALPGLSLDLLASGTSSLSVAADAAPGQAVSAFVEAYNAVLGNLASLGSASAGAGLGAFFLRTRLAEALGAGGLAQVGISTNVDGTLTFDSARFTAALNTAPAEVAGLFTDNGQGVAEKVIALGQGPLATDELLHFAAGGAALFSSPGDSRQDALFSYLGQLGVLDASATAGLLSQDLFSQLLGTGSAAAATGADPLLQSIVAQQAFSQGLAIGGAEQGR